MINRLNDIPIGKSIAMLLYGGSGTGKTFFSATCGNRTLHIDCEDRRATIQSKLVQEKYHYNPIYKAFQEVAMPDGGALALDNITLFVNDAIDKYEDEFDIVFLDGTTAFRRFALNKALELNKKIGKSKTLDRNKALPTEVEFVDVSIQDYGAEMNMVLNFIIKMKEYCSSANKHFIMTAHERVTLKDSKVGSEPVIHSIRPGFTGRTFPDDVTGQFDLTWHTEVEGQGDTRKYLARTEGDSALIAKSCFPGLFPVKYYSPDFQATVKAIQSNTPILAKR